MAPKSPWNKRVAPTHGSSPKAATTAPAIDYEETQTDEIEALRAIYSEDFEDVETKSAWSKTTDRSFKLRLRSLSEPELFINLSVTLTATYPRSVPLLDVTGLEELHDRTKKRIRDIIRVRPQQLAGDVMIYPISSDIQEALEDAVQARQQGTLPSLEYERVMAEETANMLAQQAKDAEAQRRREAEEEENRVLNQMVDREINRRERQKPSHPHMEGSSLNLVNHTQEIVSFDQPTQVQVGSGSEFFKQVTVSTLLSKSSTEAVHLASPLIQGGSGPPLLAVKRRIIRKDRKQIIELESVLTELCKLSHTSLIHFYVYRIDKIDTFTSELILCIEYADRGSLHDLLSLCQINVEKARQWTIDLLEGLDYIHRNGMAHGNLSTNTVYLTGSPTPLVKLVDIGYGHLLETQNENIPLKWKSPDEGPRTSLSLRKTDIWDLGVLVIQMFLGLQALREYHSPFILPVKLNLSDAFQDFFDKIFSTDIKKRPSAFDLLPVEFLRTDTQVLDNTCLSIERHGSGHISPMKRRSRHNSSTTLDPISRYTTEFTDLGRLGKGGFGEVVKARNKLDGGVYAIKKIKQTPQLLDKVLSEVILLNRLNHPYVVRYFSTWLEHGVDSPQEDLFSTTDETLSEGSHVDFAYPSTGGLDFVSSNGYPEIEFGFDEEDDQESDVDDHDVEESETDGSITSDDLGDGGPGIKKVTNGSSKTESTGRVDGNDLRLNKSRSNSRRPLSILYIQMELCDRKTLRDLILKKLPEDDAWRFTRQITEGLQHIHSHGIIHRDLKPDNVFVDASGNPKIGDFGLATTGQYYSNDTPNGSKTYVNVDITRSVGTALYVAPELQSTSSSSYNEKVDMYSLGIMLFEMNNPFGTAMERINEIQRIRQKHFQLPPIFQPEGEKSAQGRVLSSLISHKPSERPSSTELLRQLPLKIEDETIRQALDGLSDASSPYHQKLMSALFSSDITDYHRIKSRAWGANAVTVPEESSRIRMKEVARESLRSVFKRHGAEEIARDGIFPLSGYYTNSNVVQLMDASGNYLQLPYDFTLPYARQLARQKCAVRCTYAIGCAYRDTFTGGPPRTSEEADFDIVNSEDDQNISINDAEVVKVVDEILSELPSSDTFNNTSFHLNSGSLLKAILEHCRIPVAQHFSVIETMSKLGFQHWTWPKVRSELRNIGLSDTTLDDLGQFDFRDVPDRAFSRLRIIFAGTTLRVKNRAENGIQELRLIVELTKKFNVSRRIHIVPLGCFNAKFYSGMLFQCVLEKKNSRSVIAAGGRYDELIRTEASVEGGQVKQGAVGVCIGIDTIAAYLLKANTTGHKGTFLKDRRTPPSLPKRCDVVIVANGSEALSDASMKVLASLWACSISAELAADGSLVDEHSCAYVVTMRHEASTTVRVLNTKTRVENSDVAISTLTSYITQELRDSVSHKTRLPLVRSPSSHHHENERKHNVEILMARHGSKKSNKMQHVQDAQKHWEQKLEHMKDAPILAVETRDDVLKLIQETRLSDGESWRKAAQNVNLNERQYVQQIQDRLEVWRQQWTSGDGAREACVYNFRTENCIYYDLGL